MSMETGGEGAAPTGVEAVADAAVESFAEGTEEAPAEAGATEEEAPSQPPQRFKVKPDGKEEEVDLDTLLKRYELSQASHKRMEEASRLRKEAEAQAAQMKALVEQAKADPGALFKALGVEARGWAEKYLTEQLELELLSPEERELRELRSWRQQQEAERVKKQEEEAQAQKELLSVQAATEIESEVVDALKSSGLKATPRTVARVAEIILASLEGEGPRMKATDALQRLQREYRSDVADHLESLDPETLEREYPSLYAKILEHSARKKAPVPTFERGTGKRNNEATRKPKSWDEWLKD